MKNSLAVFWLLVSLLTSACNPFDSDCPIYGHPSRESECYKKSHPDADKKTVSGVAVLVLKWEEGMELVSEVIDHAQPELKDVITYKYRSAVLEVLKDGVASQVELLPDQDISLDTTIRGLAVGWSDAYTADQLEELSGRPCSGQSEILTTGDGNGTSNSYIATEDDLCLSNRIGRQLGKVSESLRPTLDSLVQGQGNQ